MATRISGRGAKSTGDLDASGGNGKGHEGENVAKAGPIASTACGEGANALTELGEKIFLDRYALKDMTKATLKAGDLVVVCVDLKTGQREIGNVLSIEGNQVRVELRDGTEVSRAVEHVDKPVETTPEEMMERVARGIAEVEEAGRRAEWEQEFRWLLDGWKFVPGGRILAAAGTEQALTYYNCYVVPSPKDSRAGIVETLSQMMEIMSRGGGVGINVSSLRPRHGYVKGVNGRSSGSVSWGGLYSFVTGLIEQGGSRRGALMIILNVWHPDVLEFISSKREAGKITNANISVGITDAFMDAVHEDREWDLVFPDTSDPEYDATWDGDLETWRAKGKRVLVHRTVRARQIWDSIIESAWASAEPGVFFVERYNKMSNSWYFAPILCTNPCQPSWATVLTPGGIRRIGEVHAGDSIWSGRRWTRVAQKVATGVKPVYAFRTEAGTFYGTENHRVVQNGVKVEARNATSVDAGVSTEAFALVPAGHEGQLLVDGHVIAEPVAKLLANGSEWYARQRSYPILSRERVSEEAVFDITVEDEEHTYWTDGLLVSNCGEQGLPAWGVCNLGALNLSKFVEDGEVQWDELRRATRAAVRFLDDVIDATPYFFEENRGQQLSERRVGLGTMGLAEMLIKLGIRYGSEDSTRFIDRLYEFFASESYVASADYAAEKGSFPRFEAEKFLRSGYMEAMPARVREAVRENGIRNVTLLTQAPNGTTGTMVGTSTGIEPFYSWTYFRKSRLGTHEERVAVLQEWQEENPGEALPDYFVNAMELSPEEHIRVEAAIQRWIDSSISKTCNTPANYTVAQTRELYELMYRLGCKGGTIYRDTSRDEQVLHTANPQESTMAAKEHPKKPAASRAAHAPAAAEVKVRPRPYMRHGVTVSKNTPAGTAHITMNDDDEGRPFEVFVEIGKGGSDIKAMAEALGRLISLTLRLSPSTDPHDRVIEVVNQLKGIGGAKSLGFGKDKVRSLPDAVAQALEERYGVKGSTGGIIPHEIELPNDHAAVGLDLCPSCGNASFVHEEGCMTCHACGYSEC